MFRRRKRRRRLARAFVLLAVIVTALCWFKYRECITERLQRRPPGIIVHHSASPPRAMGRIIDAAALDRMHAHRGFSKCYKGKVYHIGYHFVILQDGAVQAGRPIGCRGAHTHGREIYNRHIGICLVGNFSSAANRNGSQGPIRPTKAQLRALAKLCSSLMDEYGIKTANIKRHRDVNQTECPGDRFPYRWLIGELNHGQRAASAPKNEPKHRKI
ncbi:MAG: peptidoglycan recognition family protein [Armatimonadota bacterium]|nr:peptidoglycan recognition family protein [Armatimonadota bacterium]